MKINEAGIGGMDMKRNCLNVLKSIKDKGFDCWLVGSAVREIIMGTVPAALSMVVDAPSYEILTENFGGEIVKSRTYPYLQTQINGMSSQLSLLNGRSIHDELALRDFSINAIAVRWDGFFEDPFMGRHDIRNRLVRITGDNVKILESNPLRVVRMIRFAVSLDMNIYWKSEQMVRDFINGHNDEIINAINPRWGREIFISMRGKPYDILRLTDHYGLASLIMPDLGMLKNIRISEKETLFSHTLDTLNEIQKFMLKRKSRPTDLIIALTGLFHHIGSEEGKETDLAASSESARKYLRKWGAPDNLVDRIITVMRKYKMPYVERSEEELCIAALDEGFETMEAIIDFALCNSKADKNRNLEIIQQNRVKFDEICRRIDEMRYKMDGLRYISGEEISKRLSIDPSETIEKILRDHDLNVGTGVISSKREALAWLDSLDLKNYR